MRLADYQQYLPHDKETAIKINVSWHYFYPACSTTPWQLDGVIATLLEDGYCKEKLYGCHNRTVVVSARRGELANKQPLSAIADYLAAPGGCSTRAIPPTYPPQRRPGQGGGPGPSRGRRHPPAARLRRSRRDRAARGEHLQAGDSGRHLALVGAKELGVHVTMSFDPKFDQVVADRVQIQQVMVNLLRNGIDAMRASKRRELSVRVGKADKDGFTVVRVSDGRWHQR